MPGYTQSRVAAAELRPRARDARTSCGFCEGPHGSQPGRCRDAGGHCHGTWPHFVRPTEDNPEGLWTCRCSAAGHPGRQLSQEEKKAS